MTHSYQYKPLPAQCHSRILELSPSPDRNAAIRGSLRDINIYQDYDYRALSYTWGPPTFTQKIILDRDAYLKITPSLHDALVRFRDPHRVVRLWVDALCINQEDVEEKARQIPMMADIYRTASMVLMWLGDYQSEGSSLDYINAASRKIEFPGVAKDVYPHVQRLLALKWFTRRWVVQEAVLNTHVQVYCGRSANMPWQRLIDVVLYLVRVSGSVGGLRVVQMMSTLQESHRARTQAGPIPNTGILDILTSFSSLACGDARDCIFALAGLASDVSIRHGPRPRTNYNTDIVVQVDYEKSVQEVYIDFAASHLCDRTRLGRLLQIASQRSDGTHLKGIQGVCSWAPDWRLSPVRGSLSGGIDFRTCKVRVGQVMSELRIDFSPPVNGQAESLGYVSYSRVDSASAAFPSDASEGGIAAWVRSVWQKVIVVTCKLQRASNLSGTQLSVLLGQFERLVTEDPHSPWLQLTNGMWLDTFRSSSEFRRMVLGDRGSVYVPPSSPDLFRAIRTIMSGRCLLLATVISPDTGDTSGVSSFSKASSLFSKKHTQEPSMPWPVMAIGPSHSQPNDVLCSPSKVEIQCLPNDAEGRSHSYYEHLGKVSCILRPYSGPGTASHPPSPPRTPSPSNTRTADVPRFLYVGEVKSYRLYEAKFTGKYDPRVQKRAIAQHQHRLNSIILC
ncbi:heterokaryon incompatibility protein-domain-containing protein [Microdochium trichocladiopsis]|uniref:Heterokaryon incompatibility protein-domain-containing protein n=1 Tax=Microdochium trichocladiopsis TaxID=1682393 RepID=A0A9P8XY46_9PEZI|nr:heterokaryon incompatibility protein-domain-containing protein [Microdochium trichocladiopsis]KAH7025785.1 heterokaryon incompatibility protein-domain-containing protein [Microdochium trichocladiopsis]